MHLPAFLANEPRPFRAIEARPFQAIEAMAAEDRVDRVIRETQPELSV